MRACAYAHAGFEDEMIGLGHLPTHLGSASVPRSIPFHASSFSLSFLSYTYLEKYNNRTLHPNVITDIRVYSGKGSGGIEAGVSVAERVSKNKKIENGAKGGQSATGPLVSRVLPPFLRCGCYLHN